MSLFTPAWKSANERRALAKINKITDPQLLLTIAFDKEISDDRAIAAIKRIDNNEALYIFVKKSNNYRRIKAAVGQITDQRILAKIAIECDDYEDKYLVICAVENLTDREMIIKVFKKAERYPVLEACANKITDQNTLIRLAKDEGEGAYHAVRRITGQSQSVWLDITFHAKASDARKEAAREIKDLGLLKEYLGQFDLKKDKNARDALVAIVWYTRQNNISRYILDNAADQELLAEIVKSNRYSDSEIHCAAIRKITDKELLLQIAKKVYSEPLRDRMLELGILDKEMLVWAHYGEDPANWDRLIEEEGKFYDKLKEKDNGDKIWSAYIRESLSELSAYPCEETIEALSLITLRHERGWNNDTRKKLIRIHELLKKYYSHRPDLKKALCKYANGKKISHDDYDRPVCEGGHDDTPEVVFTFTE